MGTAVYNSAKNRIQHTLCTLLSLRRKWSMRADLLLHRVWATMLPRQRDQQHRALAVQTVTEIHRRITFQTMVVHTAPVMLNPYCMPTNSSTIPQKQATSESSLAKNQRTTTRHIRIRVRRGVFRAKNVHNDAAAPAANTIKCATMAVCLVPPTVNNSNNKGERRAHFGTIMSGQQKVLTPMIHLRHHRVQKAHFGLEHQKVSGAITHFLF